VNLKRALETEGWLTEVEAQYLASIAYRYYLAPFTANIVEVGSWKGRSTCALASNVSVRVWAVDTWKGSAEHQPELSKHHPLWLYGEFLKNVEGLPVIPLMLPSLVAAKWLERAGIQPDIVFIDANHDYESVKADILAWQPLLAPAGILCGHDYDPPHWMGVKQAVDECVPKFRIVPGTTIWSTEGA